MPFAPPGAGVPGPAQLWTEPDSVALWPWLLPLDPTHITQYWGQNGETGIDLGLPMGTVISSLTWGTVLDIGYYDGGGVASVKSTLPGIGPASVYYQHLDTIAVVPGQTVWLGTTIGTSGGQLSGGHHPSTAVYSSGPHLEVGINAPYGGFWQPLGANVNPLPWLQNLAANGPPLPDRLASVNHVAQGVSGVVQTVGNALTGTATAGSVASDFLGIEKEIDAALTFKPLTVAGAAQGITWQGLLPWNWGQTQSTVTTNVGDILLGNVGVIALRGMLFLAGFIIFIAFLAHLISVDVSAAKGFGKGNPAPGGGIMPGAGGTDEAATGAEGAAGDAAGGIETLAEAPLMLA